MPARVTVTIPESLLARLDSIAETEGVTRSDVVREAAASYLTERDRRLALMARREAVEEDLRWLEQLATRVPSGTPPSLDLLQEIRADAGGRGEPVARPAPDSDELR
jgi:predicted transcriptional regulator